MAKLTDTQLVILNTAAKRDSRLLLPFSRTLKVNAGTITKAVNRLLAKQLIEERLVTKDEKDWRSDDDGRYALIITDAGLKALGLGDENEAAGAPEHATDQIPAAKGETGKLREKKTGGKLEGMLALVRRANGATIEDLQKATGWQPHSVRAALTGFRKQGVEITRSKNGIGVTTYRAVQA